MSKKLTYDTWLFGAAMLIVVIGLVMIFSASAIIATQKFGAANPYYFMTRQCIWLIAGGALMLILMHIDSRVLADRRVIYAVLGGVLLALIVALFQVPINGTHRWIVFSKFQLQPSEFAKPALILFLAHYLARREERINELTTTLLPLGFVLALFAGLILLEPDFGTASTIVLVACGMIFAAGIAWRRMVLFAFALIPAAIALALGAAYRRDRLFSFINPEADPRGKGFQALQSLIAIGTGGLQGLGIGNGRQKLFFLPEPHNDFIFAIIGEELGFIGAVFLIGAFAFLAWRGFRIARYSQERFAFFCALGFTLMIAVQALINISVALSLLPTKGLPLPLVSYGGSSLIASLIAVGVLLNLSTIELMSFMGEKGVQTLMIAGGGTGGHIYPAIAIAREFLAFIPNRSVVFVGTERGLEKTIVPKAGFPLEFISAGGLKGKGPIELVRNLAKLPLGFLQAFRLIGKHKPAAVLGVGGYSSGPVLAAAKLRGVPTIIHEQNAFPGLTNRLLAKFVTAVVVAFADAGPRMKRKDAIVTGNPIRREFFKSQDSGLRTQDSAKRRLLIFGGSQGSHILNETMSGALLFLAHLKDSIDIVHQTGQNELAKVQAAYRSSAFENARVVPYLDPMVDEIAAADLVVSRAGAMTIGELAAIGRPSILIPFAAATNNHQEVNARVVEKAGGGIVITETELTPEKLAGAISDLIANPDRLKRMGIASMSLATPEATKRIIDTIDKII